MWIVCQIGAREHYAIARALHSHAMLGTMITDFWVPPGSVFSRLPGGRRLRDRWHQGLAEAEVRAPNARMLGFELRQRLAKQHGWPVMIERNRVFQQWAVRELGNISDGHRPPLQASHQPSTKHQAPITLFSYSYAARELFRFAKARGWTTVLGQIDPGPEEERIVTEEQRRYPHLKSNWQPTPTGYWESWREELALADRIIVNSEWSRQCLLKEGVPEEKIEIVPLVYKVGTDRRAVRDSIQHSTFSIEHSRPFRLLFLGQIILRKGVGRLLEAMRLLRDEPVELILAGPSEIDPTAWADLPHVRWLGSVPRSEVGKVYQEADVFILPTLSDGYALTQLEALAHGLPVIASKYCGAAVRHGQNGWILEDLEPETIAAAIRMAMVERPPDIRPPEFSLEDLAEALNG